MAIGVAALLAASGCTNDQSGMTQVRPPGFKLVERLPSDEPVQTIEIRNGRGDLVFEQATNPNDKYLQPPAGIFDGTLHVKWTTNDGRTGEQTLTHDPAQSFRLQFDSKDNRFFVLDPLLEAAPPPPPLFEMSRPMRYSD